MKTFSEIHAARGAQMTVRNGKEVPASVSDRVTAHGALRRNFVVVDYSHLAIVDVSGDDAFDFLSAIVSGDLAAIRDEQAIYTFILDDAGQVVLDLYVLCDDERYLLLTECVSGADLAGRLALRVSDQSVEIADRSDELSTVLFEGPYSWEIAKELFGMDVIGLPFMEHMPISGGILFRAGNHGEFSYQVICGKDAAGDLLEDRDGLYAKYGAVFAGLDFQDLARLENPCWDETRLGVYSRCPIELQSQWMVRYDKDEFIGKGALEDKLAAGPSRRMVGFVTDLEGEADLQPGQHIRMGDAQVGIVVTVGYSSERNRTIGQALLASDYAYAEIVGFKAGAAGAEVSISTSTIPFVRNFSFLVNPLEHSYVDSGRHKNVLEQLEAAQAIKST
jgi:glycine cleavage system aminomethyltransferase T